MPANVGFRPYSALRNTMILIGTIAVTELLIMLVLHVLHAEAWMSGAATVLADTLLLSIVASLAVYHWVFKPLDLAEKQRLSEELRRGELDRDREYAEQIVQSKQDWEDTFDTITDMVTIHDREFNIVRSNKAARDLLKLPAFGDYLRKCYMYYHGTDCAPAHCQSCKSLITGKPTTVEIFEPHLNKFIEIRAIPRFDKDGRLSGLIHVVRDITEHRKLEEQLRQAQKMEAVGQLAGGVAHDFNNILTAILGYAYILDMKMGAQNRFKPYVEDIRTSAEKATQLTQGLLAFSRKQILNPKPVDLNEVVSKLHRLTSRLIGEDIDYQTHLSAANLTVMADSGQVEQVLVNLITNARDAMPRGGTMTISTGPAAIDSAFISSHGFGKAGSYALVAVSDSGLGMEDKTRDRIFEPFFTTKEVGKGTGLGLAIVYGIVKQHDGFILCESRPDTGTTFSVYFPVVAPAREERDQTTAAPEHGTECILLAEDDAGVRNTTRNILEEFGYQVVAAADGEDALLKFSEHRDRIQLLIMDVVMPKKNGMEAFEEIKKIRPGIKVLFLSGYPNEIIHKKWTLDTGLNFLAKPASPAALLSTMRRLLDGKNSS